MKYSVWLVVMATMGLGAFIAILEGDEYGGAIGLMGVFLFYSVHILVDTRIRLRQLEEKVSP